MADTRKFSDDTPAFDIIIVGAGTAGCVLANRLSQDPDLQILVIEAGRNCNDDPRVKTPGRSGECQGNSGLDWQFVTEPQKHLNGRVISHPRGRLIGGSSAINSHALVFPSRAWLDAWADFGNDGWNADVMIPYYNKFYSIAKPSGEVIENLHLDAFNQTEERLHGPIKVSFPTTTNQLNKVWVDTFDKAGHRIYDDVLTGSIGVGGVIIPGAVVNGERSHAGVAYLSPILSRTNVTVFENTVVKRVIFDQISSLDVNATGVECRVGSLEKIFRARIEVILCAGAFQSPQILELSGIGESKLLGSLGIPVIVDNPFVGENLQDHLNCGPSFEVNDGIPTADDLRNPAVVQQMKDQYQYDKTGGLARGGVHTFGYSSLRMFSSEAEMDELVRIIDQYIDSGSNQATGKFLPSQSLQNAFIRKMAADPGEATATIYMSAMQRNLDQPEDKRKAILQPGNYISLIAMLAHPFSRGSVHIRSTDPTLKPVVDFQYFSHELDAQVFGHHLMDFEKLVELEPLASCLKPGGRRLPKTFPGKIESVEQASEMIKICSGTNYHPACTCPMMSRELGGVVNDRLIVHGTKNLRVCDASIFPVIPRGNILSSVYASAERAADLIRDDLESAGLVVKAQ
ncbi:MAG: hypothetical protein M1820_009957 [Bogoriella megaspora]|nr:MAG: hypothetical protein M1820_009957 [Bogoriella megaspora]